MSHIDAPIRIQCRPSMWLIYWCLALHCLLFLLPLSLAYYQEALTFLPIIVCSFLWSWRKLRYYSPELTLHPPKQVIWHERGMETHSLLDSSFFNSWFCCLYLEVDKRVWPIVIFRDSLSVKDYKNITRMVHLLKRA